MEHRYFSFEPHQIKVAAQPIAMDNLRREILANLCFHDSFDGDLQDSPSHAARCEADSNFHQDSSLAVSLENSFQAVAPSHEEPEPSIIEPEGEIPEPAAAIGTPIGTDLELLKQPATKNEAIPATPPVAAVGPLVEEEIFHESDCEEKRQLKKRPSALRVGGATKMKRPAASGWKEGRPAATADGMHGGAGEDGKIQRVEESGRPTICPNADYSYKDESGEWQVWLGTFFYIVVIMVVETNLWPLRSKSSSLLCISCPFTVQCFMCSSLKQKTLLQSGFMFSGWFIFIFNFLLVGRC